jgi:hypothetical protein
MQRANWVASTPDPAEAILASFIPAQRQKAASAFAASSAAAGKVPDVLRPSRDRLEGENW